MTNLIAAWHDQLIEMMGAMGIREARRLRGEAGRAMFFEDLEEDTFGRLFGARKRLNRLLPENTVKTWCRRLKYRVYPEAPSRFRNEIAKYIIRRETSKCTFCGKCAKFVPKTCMC